MTYSVQLTDDAMYDLESLYDYVFGHDSPPSVYGNTGRSCLNLIALSIVSLGNLFIFT
ncbi:MAG: hypothetical protein ACI909_002390 [Planctomycetota bacterium]|jgi:hypothetical protein